MNIAIILSGGTGTRLGGDIPKQYIEVNDKPIIADCITTFENHELVDGYVIVASSGWKDYIRKFVGEKFKGFAIPGETRQLSIFNGLKAIEDMVEDDDIVIIHDAARPFVFHDMISSLITATESCDGAMPALPVKDTMYLKKNGKVYGLLDRDSLIAGQSPEAFRFRKYLEANEDLFPKEVMYVKGSTEPAFLAGMDIAVVPGDEKNFKITTKEDLDKYRLIKTQS